MQFIRWQVAGGSGEKVVFGARGEGPVAVSRKREPNNQIPRNRYELGSEASRGGFPLDAGSDKLCTEIVMMRSKSRLQGGLIRSSVARLFGHSHMGWRKVATVAAAALAVALGYHVVFGQNGLTAYEQKRQDTQSLRVQLQSLEHENEQLKGHVDRLQTDPNAIEHQAREELHYTRPGEVIYTLPDTPSSKK